MSGLHHAVDGVVRLPVAAGPGDLLQEAHPHLFTLLLLVVPVVPEPLDGCPEKESIIFFISQRNGVLGLRLGKYLHTDGGVTMKNYSIALNTVMTIISSAKDLNRQFAFSGRKFQTLVKTILCKDLFSSEISNQPCLPDIPVARVVLVFDDGSSFGAHEIQDLPRALERRVMRRGVTPQRARPDVRPLLQEEPDNVRAVRL